MTCICKRFSWCILRSARYECRILFENWDRRIKTYLDNFILYIRPDMDYTDKRNTMIRYMDVARAEDDQTQYLMMEENAMRYKPLPIGIDNFKQLIEQGYYYVDKTAFIKDLIDMKGAVNLFTRPRRFGKTLNMSMLQYFFRGHAYCKGRADR